MRVKVIPNPHKAWALSKAEELRSLIERDGWQVVDEGEDISIVIGGDGTLLYNKDRIRRYILLGHRDTYTKSLPWDAPWDEVKELIERGKTIPLPALLVEVEGKAYKALFDAQLRSPTPERAARLSVSFHNKSYRVVGDGVLAATPIGSTAYMRAVSGPRVALSVGKMALACIACSRSFQPSIVEWAEARSEEGKALLVVDNKAVGQVEGARFSLAPSQWEWVVKDEQSVRPLL